jgi:hypothetical protein
MNDNLALIISILSLSVSAIIGIYSWKKNRVIYGIEKLPIREPRGTANDILNASAIKQINEKLSAGEYTILSTYQRSDGDTELLLGRLRKGK